MTDLIIIIFGYIVFGIGYLTSNYKDATTDEAYIYKKMRKIVCTIGLFGITLLAVISYFQDTEKGRIQLQKRRIKSQIRENTRQREKNAQDSIAYEKALEELGLTKKR